MIETVPDGRWRLVRTTGREDDPILVNSHGRGIGSGIVDRAHKMNPFAPLPEVAHVHVFVATRSIPEVPTNVPAPAILGKHENIGVLTVVKGEDSLPVVWTIQPHPARYAQGATGGPFTRMHILAGGVIAALVTRVELQGVANSALHPVFVAHVHKCPRVTGTT